MTPKVLPHPIQGYVDLSGKSSVEGGDSSAQRERVAKHVAQR